MKYRVYTLDILTGEYDYFDTNTLQNLQYQTDWHHDIIGVEDLR